MNLNNPTPRHNDGNPLLLAYELRTLSIRETQDQLRLRSLQWHLWVVHSSGKLSRLSSILFESNMIGQPCERWNLTREGRITEIHEPEAD